MQIGVETRGIESRLLATYSSMMEHQYRGTNNKLQVSDDEYMCPKFMTHVEELNIKISLVILSSRWWLKSRV
ncbi:hypothetical protein MTR_8g019013 [Medicago truncatula]|uniref:Uncharacterized protein n=1 Tax=Medicago truncatula TaxID=3880 RepID=A0A072TM01_MEDTR|nr:hypothetical protein MTR_8g019013 [Medicago truncatula]